MYNIFRATTFKKDYRKLNKQDHKLTGNYLGCKECHVKPDLLLIYKIDNNILELALVRTGNHSKLFK